MAQFETILRTDLKKPVTVQALQGVVFTADSQGNKITAEVLDGGAAAALSGSVTGYIIRADGATLAVAGTLSGNKASIVLPESAYAVPGPLDIAIRLVAGSGSSQQKTVLAACRGYVQRSSTDTIIDPGHVIPSLEELLAQITVMEQATADAEAATQAATAAAANANTKANTANTAATNANTKAAAANTAAEAANTAAAAANQAAAGISQYDSRISSLETSLDEKKFYNSVTDLGLTAGSATLTSTWNAMVNNSMGFFTGDDFPMSELPGSSQRGIVIIHRLLTSRGVILWASKTQTDGTKNQLCVMQWTGNSPSGVWRDVADLGLAYAAGDTYAEAASSSARNVVPGLIAGSAKQILFRVTTPKSMANISNISVTALAGWFAGINGIIKDSNGDSAADNTNWLSQNGVAVAAYKKSDNTAIIRLTCESALGNAANGPCNGMLAFALSFS